MDENTSVIHIEFERLGSVNFTKYIINNVSPMQVLAVASYLELSAKFQLNKQMVVADEQIDASKLLVPEPKISMPGR
jgi:hypothetical protein